LTNSLSCGRLFVVKTGRNPSSCSSPNRGKVMSKKGWLCLGIATEAFHAVFIVAVLIFGELWLPNHITRLAILLTVIGQVIFLWCPLSVFANFCFRKHDPEGVIRNSITLYLYARFGRAVGIPIFIVLTIISVLVGMETWSS